MSRLTAEQIDAFSKLASGATPGPWTRSTESWDGTEYMVVRGREGEIVAQEPVEFSVYPSGAFIDTVGEAANIEFISTSREAVPALLDELAAVRAERDKLYEAIMEMRLGDGDERDMHVRAAAVLERVNDALAVARGVGR